MATSARSFRRRRPVLLGGVKGYPRTARTAWAWSRIVSRPSSPGWRPKPQYMATPGLPQDDHAGVGTGGALARRDEAGPG
jgi:hypothetical protein